MEITPEILLVLGAVAVAAGFVDSIAGGGGLLTLPAMLLAGMNPIAAIATNKLQGTFGVAMASLQYVRHGGIDWRSARVMMLVSAVASMLGALFVSSVPVDQLKAWLPLVLIMIAVYFLFAPRAADVDAEPRISQPAFTSTVVPPIAFYDGAIGPGTGSFFTLGFLTLRGLSILRATGYTKLLNLASNVGALILFVLAGKPVWLVGLVMAIGSIVGARIGSRLAIAKGGRIIKPVLVIACTAMAIRLLADPAHPLWQFLS